MPRESSAPSSTRVAPVPEISIVIVNRNGAALLPRCLAALDDAMADEDFQTVVIDNDSTDGSVDSLDGQQPLVEVVRLARNYGFGRAMNIGLQRACGRYVLLLNTDCFIKPDLVRGLRATLDANPAIGVVGPQLLNLDGSLQRSCHDDPRPLVLFLEHSGLWRLIRRVPVAQHRFAFASSTVSRRDVDYISGSCMLVRQEALEASGPFDERYFFYWEEADLCRRLRRLGWRVVFEPSVQAVHIGGASSQAPSLLLEFFRSLYLYYDTYYTPRQLLEARAIVRLMALWKAGRAGIGCLRSSFGLRLPWCRERSHRSLSPGATVAEASVAECPDSSSHVAHLARAQVGRCSCSEMRLWLSVLRL
jgi:N-acetylglucosaminyl-diphospho-decaprenol L-rhamnosyltransferase